MRSKHRHWRAVRRGRLNPATFDVRNKKLEKQFDRWFNGLYCHKLISDDGTVLGHTRVPGGRGLIHKGRKP